MFDKLICNVLNKFLGTYIENLDESNLKLSLWKGELFIILMRKYINCHIWKGEQHIS